MQDFSIGHVYHRLGNLHLEGTTTAAHSYWRHLWIGRTRNIALIKLVDVLLFFDAADFLLADVLLDGSSFLGPYTSLYSFSFFVLFYVGPISVEEPIVVGKVVCQARVRMRAVQIGLVRVDLHSGRFWRCIRRRG